MNYGKDGIKTAGKTPRFTQKPTCFNLEPPLPQAGNVTEKQRAMRNMARYPCLNPEIRAAT